jgi:acid phosphatase type 7
MFRPSEHSRAPLSDYFRGRVLRARRLPGGTTHSSRCSEPIAKRRITTAFLEGVGLLAVSFALTGCAPSPVQPVTVSVSSSSSTVLLGNTLQFSATVTGTSNRAVTWSVTTGTISPAGLYTAPADLPKGAAVTVTATSQAQSTVSGQEIISVTSDIAVSVTTSPPNTSSLLTSASLRLNEIISSAGHPDPGVVWSVNGVANGSASVGTISSNGPSAIYTAPSVVPTPSTVTIQITSVADSTKSASIMLSVTSSVQVSVSPPFIGVLLGNTQLFTATVTGSMNTAVIWAVNGVPGGNQTLGFISSSGLYTAPVNLPNPATLTIAATSLVDNSKIGTASAFLSSDIAISITTNPSNQQPVPYGTVIQLTANVSSQGNPNLTVSWFVNGVENGNPAVGTVTMTGTDTATYTAPQSYANPNPLQIVAQSNADPSKQGAIQLTIFADAVLVGAGDIAVCGQLYTAQLTANLLATIPGTVFADGDLAYPGTSGFPEGSDEIFKCYDQTWGVLLNSRTRPALGNHEYMTANAQGYFDYWGGIASAYWGSTGGDPSKGYYSYDLGTWHVVVINSSCEIIGGCDIGSPQQQWLQTDLSAHPGVCTLAYWHAPYFVPLGVGPTDEPELLGIWRTLYDNDVHVVVNGHVHEYERWERQDPLGNLDPARGIRQFVAGTGGAGCATIFGSTHCTEANAHEDFAYSGIGVLELTLHKDSYDWQFVALHLITTSPPTVFTDIPDSGTESCHSTTSIIRPLATGSVPYRQHLKRGRLLESRGQAW